MRISSIPIVISRATSLIGSYVVLPLLAVLITTDVVLRYGFNSPIWWSLEASRYLLMLYFILALADSIREGVHIKMTLFFDQLPRSARRAVSLLAAGGLIFAFALLAKAAYHQMVFRYELGSKTNDLQMPLWAVYAAVALTCFMLILQVIALAADVFVDRRETLDDNFADKDWR